MPPALPHPSLVADLTERLRTDIRDGRWRIGDRLPSAAQLTAEHGVSRTVVREAVSALAADGLVAARRGAGVFVTAPPPDPLAAIRGIDPDRLSSVIELLELRAAIEVEAAGLAALRRSPVQEERILEAARAAAEGPPEARAEADFALHLAIAQATNNPRFPGILSMLGPASIPRRALASDPAAAAALPETYQTLLRDEHDRIVAAILDGDAEAARAAMRHHLAGSRARYRRLLHAQARGAD